MALKHGSFLGVEPQSGPWEYLYSIIWREDRNRVAWWEFLVLPLNYSGA